MKKRGFGEGRWNGFGGKVGADETLEDATKREVREEAGIEVEELEKIGLMDFTFHKKPNEVLEVHIFCTHEYTGIPTESEEMKPQWFHIDEIPLNAMWPGDKYWIPLFLEKKKFKGRFLFGDGDAVLEHALEEVAEVV